MAINLTNSNIKGNCDLKCDYVFNYGNSNSIATNMGSSIQISYEDSVVPPVTYNNVKYIVSMIQIVYPSIILYNNSQALGNIIIEHTSVKDKGILLVIIPLVSSSSTSTGSNLITQVIQSVATNAPNTKENVNLNIQGFTLQSIVPKAPYYTTTLSNGSTVIMYDLNNAIGISDTTNQSLTTIISNTTATASSSNSIFYNSKGPNSQTSGGEDEIYISCHPTGNSEEETKVTFEKQKNDVFTINWSKLSKNPLFITFLYACIFIILLLFLSMVINMLSSTTLKLPSFSSRNKVNNK
jgi:hypothetical protein